MQDASAANVSGKIVSIAYLCVKTLGLDGCLYRRGYIQSSLHERIPERSAQRIFSAADRS
ncbi:MAG: hypothetical protein DMG16_15200 [Acidobacteria bacterium]|nr:MAG: hypothetical protein DMG16_15200 [Acidobacteriota bacterium]